MSNLRTLPVGAVVTHKNVVLGRKNIGTCFLTYPISHQGDNTFNDLMAIDYTLTTNTPGGLVGKELFDVDTWLQWIRYHRPGSGAFYDYYGQGGPVLGALTMHNFLKTLDYWHARDCKVTYASYIWYGKFPTLAMVRSYYYATGTNTLSVGSKTFTLPTGKTLTNEAVKFYMQGSESTLFMTGTITSYNPTTGETVVNITAVTGTGSSVNWRVMIEVAPGSRATDVSDQNIAAYLYKLFGAEDSVTSNTIGLGSKSFTTSLVGRLYTPTNFLKISSKANPANYMFGNVVSYDNDTGALVLNCTEIGGSGTFADWDIRIASAAGRTLAGHPALANWEMTNESMSDSYTTALCNEFGRVARIANRIVKKYLPSCTVTGDTNDQGRLSLSNYMIGSAASAFAVEGDLGTGKQACDYLDGWGYNNYYFNNASFALHNQACQLNLYPGQVQYGSAAVNRATIKALTSVNRASNWFGKDPNTIKMFIGEHSTVGGSADIGGYALQTTNWTHGADTEEEAFWNIFRTLIPAILQTQDGNGDYGTVIYFGQDNAGANAVNGGISQASIQAHTTGEVSFTLNTTFQVGFNANIPERRIVITAPSDGGWPDLGLAPNEKKRFAVRQISGDTVYIPNTVYSAKPATGVNYSHYQADWAPYREDYKRFYETFCNVPLTIGTIQGLDVSDKVVSPATKRKYPGMFVIVPDIGTNSQYAGTYYINGTKVGSKW